MTELKSVWHTADIKPKSLKTFVYKTDKGHIGTGALAIDSGWNPVLLPEFYRMSDFEVAERIIKWCYVDDLFALETELDRTRKALEIAKDTIRHADWFFDGDYNVDAKTMHNEIKRAIKAITALEQKD